MSRRNGFTVIELIVVLVIVSILVVLAGFVAPIEVVWALLSGWVRYPLRIAGQVTIEWTSVVIAGTALVLFTWGTHRLCRGLRHTQPAESSDADAPPAWRWSSTVRLVAVVLFAFVAGTSMVGIVHQFAWLATADEPLLVSSSQAFQRSESKNNLKQIGLSTANYHAAHGVYPLGGVFDATGRGFHSWQTALLPFADQEALSARVNWDVPWTDPFHRPVFTTGVPLFLNPGVSKNEIVGTAGYAASHYAGNIRLLQTGTAPRLETIPDGASQTILAGEVAARFRAWGDPANLRDPGRGINTDPNGFGSPFNNGAHLLLADGSVRFVSDDIAPEVLEAMATPDGGEPIPED